MDGVKVQLLASLRKQLDGWHSSLGVQAERGDPQVYSTGCSALDGILPQGGFLPGQLIEWLGEPGSGVGTLALLLARLAEQASESCPRGNTVSSPRVGRMVVVDATHDIYPPAMDAWGISLSQLIVVRMPQALEVWANGKRMNGKRMNGKQMNGKRIGESVGAAEGSACKDLLWALDQCLRCPAVSVVWSVLPAVPANGFRRLQLAAEEGRTLGFLIRDVQMRGMPSWADMQLHVRALPTPERDGVDAHASRCWELTLLRCRRGTPGASMRLCLNERAGTLCGLSSHD